MKLRAYVLEIHGRCGVSKKGKNSYASKKSFKEDFLAADLLTDKFCLVEQNQKASKGELVRARSVTSSPNFTYIPHARKSMGVGKICATLLSLEMI
ncbi:MAG: hypothetical protein GY820_48140 [Gammaproteobacteria bacterium]|nr:hypothetical protein [Gammaproteobacteria bacterium]